MWKSRTSSKKHVGRIRKLVKENEKIGVSATDLEKKVTYPETGGRDRLRPKAVVVDSDAVAESNPIHTQRQIPI